MEVGIGWRGSLKLAVVAWRMSYLFHLSSVLTYETLSSTVDQPEGRGDLTCLALRGLTCMFPSP